ncbi:MAG TPA: hypothetical protein VHA12_04400 [Candidatus Nanoarchaeia archaeon]|nr:hypothetical protein [Candidatus Nanoarchaeia archaeon]
MQKEMSKLEKIATIASSIAIATEYALCYHNFDLLHRSAAFAQDRFRWLPINQSYFGDVPEIFTTILASGFIGDKIEQHGKTTSNKLVEKIGKYLPYATGAAVGAYYSLGETVMPYLLPGTADSKDVPAVAIAAIAAPIVTKYIVNRWKNKWKDKTLEAIEATRSKEIETI